MNETLRGVAIEAPLREAFLRGARYATLIVVPMCLKVMPVTGQAESAGTITTHLSEVAAAELPDSVRAVSIHALRAGRAGVVLSTGVVLIVDAFAGTFRRIGAGILAAPVGISERKDGAVRVFDRVARAEYVFNQTGALQSRHVAQGTPPIEAAAWVNDRWYLAVDRGRQVLLYEFSGTELSDPIRAIDIPTDRARASMFHLSPVADDKAALSFSRWPLTSVVVDASGSVPMSTLILDPTAALQEEFGSSLIDETWVALPLLSVEGGYLQVLSDLRSDHRILVVYDRDGHVTAMRAVSIPMGFTASSLPERLIFGVRTTDHDELVVYRWHPGTVGMHGRRDSDLNSE